MWGFLRWLFYGFFSEFVVSVLKSHDALCEEQPHVLLIIHANPLS